LTQIGSTPLRVDVGVADGVLLVGVSVGVAVGVGVNVEVGSGVSVGIGVSGTGVQHVNASEFG
jgi:hypothetical protein